MHLKIGISTCPNDIYIFCGIIAGKVTIPGVTFDMQYLDVQELNERLLNGSLDCAKASIHAALLLANDYGLLWSGAAIGDGVGPLVISKSPSLVLNNNSKVLCPGRLTTATLLFKLWAPQASNIEHRIFSEIMPAVADGSADCGVVIHEGRFVYKEQGFHKMCDLGDWWKLQTDAPLPLGGILARHALGEKAHQALATAIHQSLLFAQRNPELAFELMSKFAQELDPEVIWSHVKLYVNHFTEDLRGDGFRAIERMNQIAAAQQVLSAHTTPLQVIGS